jgi:hypothetical protein
MQIPTSDSKSSLFSRILAFVEYIVRKHRSNHVSNHRGRYRPLRARIDNPSTPEGQKWLEIIAMIKAGEGVQAIHYGHYAEAGQETMVQIFIGKVSASSAPTPTSPPAPQTRSGRRGY